MSLRYKGAVISATPPTTTGGNSGTAPGAWTLQQQLQAQGAGNWPNQPVWYVEDVFSTWLYTGNGSTQTITNGIDLSTYGGLAWLKRRSIANHALFDTARGFGNLLSSDTTGAQASGYPISTTTSGFTITSYGGLINYSGETYASWTFRKQPKFFDCGTFTGNGSSKTVLHNLGSTPGCIIIKSMTTGEWWGVWHRSTGTQIAYLNDTSPFSATSPVWMGTVDATSFTLTSSADNSSGTQYVYYAFAHDAGGFGLTGTDNVISCGAYTGTGAALNVSLGYEPQWILLKDASATGNWRIFDNMRGWPAPSGQSAYALFPNLSNAETDNGDLVYPNATGFQLSTNGTYNTSGRTYIYIAIRRGPMKVPTDGTTVFAPATQAGGSNYDVTFSSLPYVDTIISWKNKANSGGAIYNDPIWNDRLRGFPTDMTGATYTNNPGLDSSSTSAEGTGSGPASSNYLSGVTMNRAVWGGGWLGNSGAFEAFRRAPGFFDEVCYTGNGSSTPIPHNLTVTPELVINKRRDGATGAWYVYNATSYALLNTTGPFFANPFVLTPTTFEPTVVGNGFQCVAYLFASCPGVSKVGSYTGTGATQTIDCGFTGGARFVLIKRTDSTGDWYVWDTARGMVSGTDPSLLLNSTAAEVNANSIYTTTGGFQIVSTAAGINASGGSYIYLAIA